MCSLSSISETTAILRDQKHLWPGMYKVAVEIKDQQGKSCANVQMLDVVVCTCEANTRTCMAHIERRSDFGVAGILLLLLGLLLLLCKYVYLKCGSWLSVHRNNFNEIFFFPRVETVINLSYLYGQ